MSENRATLLRAATHFMSELGDMIQLVEPIEIDSQEKSIVLVLPSYTPIENVIEVIETLVTTMPVNIHFDTGRKLIVTIQLRDKLSEMSRWVSVSDILPGIEIPNQKEKMKTLIELRAENARLRSEMPRWVSVSEELPAFPAGKREVRVLAIWNREQCEMTYWDDGGWTLAGKWLVVDGVTHWLKNMPEPPKGAVIRITLI